MKYMKEKPTISIIIPVYNGEQYIEQCVENFSLQNNDYIEIIMINDGSTDKSWSIMKNLQNKYSNIKISNGENYGVSHARNVGLSIAEGEWIAFVDIDDILENEVFNISKVQLNDPRCDFIRFGIICDYYKNNKYLQSKKRIMQIFDNQSKDYIDCNIAESFDEIFKDNVFDSACGAFFRRSIIEQYQIRFQESMKIREDSEFVLSYMKHIENVRVLNKYFYHYRIEGNDTYHFKRNVALDDINRLRIAYNALFQEKDIKAETSIALVNRHLYQQIYGGIIHLSLSRYNTSFRTLYKYISNVGGEFETLIHSVSYKDGFHKILIVLLRRHLYMLASILCKVRLKNIN